MSEFEIPAHVLLPECTTSAASWRPPASCWPLRGWRGTWRRGRRRGRPSCAPRRRPPRPRPLASDNHRLLGFQPRVFNRHFFWKCNIPYRLCLTTETVNHSTSIFKTNVKWLDEIQNKKIGRKCVLNSEFLCLACLSAILGEQLLAHRCSEIEIYA